ncbi:MAG: tetratricopeptide repeat protein [Roseivirga sp.]|nr:tetratricopeptide repeat protein [Roseivirga sp.]
MRLRQIILLLALFSLLDQNKAWAQSSAVITAYNYLRDNDLDRARDNIDKAIDHERTKRQAKTWYYRGMIYQGIHFSNEPDKVEDAIYVAAESYEKARTLDTRRIDSNDLERRYKMTADVLFTEGVNFYNKREHVKAAGYFEFCEKIKLSYGEVDSLAVFNQGLAYESAAKFDLAIKQYQKSIAIGYNSATCYQTIASIYLRKKEDENAIKAIDEGLVKFPNDLSLLTSRINLYLRYGQMKEALNYMDRALINDSENAVLYFSRGTIHDNFKESTKAEADYKTALQINPEYFDANYNLGALYFNLGVDINNQAGLEDDNAEYEKKKNEAENLFRKSIPYLEKAQNIEPSHQATLQSLMQLYVRLNMTEKYEAVKAKLGN